MQALAEQIKSQAKEIAKKQKSGAVKLSAAAAALNAAELGGDSKDGEDSDTKILSVSNDQMVEQRTLNQNKEELGRGEDESAAIHAAKVAVQAIQKHEAQLADSNKNDTSNL